MINLATGIDGFPIFRILVMPPGGWTTAPQPWEELPQPQQLDRNGNVVLGVAQGGYEVERIRRVTLPEIDEAAFKIEFGLVNGVAVTPDDLAGMDVRIQVAPPVPDPVPPGYAPAWVTCFAGRIVTSHDQLRAGTQRAGTRVYQCQGLLAMTQRWPMGRHSHGTQSAVVTPFAWGNPGYNRGLNGWFRRVLGNRVSQYPPDPYGDMSGSDTEGVPWSYYWSSHCVPGCEGSQAWRDFEVLRHVLVSGRAHGDPLITLESSARLLDGTFPWSVNDGDSAFDLLTRILRRQRGRGLAFITFGDAAPDENNEDDIYGDLRPILRVLPQTADDIEIPEVIPVGDQAPGQAQTPIPGAGAAGNAITVCLNGDHRLVGGSLRVVDRRNAVCEFVETRGELIEVLATLSPADGSLEGRWATSDVALMNGQVNPWQRASDRFRPVFQRFSVPTAWDFKCKGFGDGIARRCDYWCADDGSVNTPDNDNRPSSTLAIRFNLDLPIYEGWDYRTATPVRWDGTQDVLPPPRMPALVLLNAGSGNWANGQWLNFNICPDDYGFLVVCGDDTETGTRKLSKGVANADKLGGAYAPTDLAVTVGITLAHRVRFAWAADPQVPEYETPRRMYLDAPGACLWLAHPGAAWQHNYIVAGTTNAGPLLSAAAGGHDDVPGVIRDDRAAMAHLHALAVRWYGRPHNLVSWSMRCCGLLPDFALLGGATSPYAVLGNVVQRLIYTGANGADEDASALDIDSPITSLEYDHTQGATTWATDWADLDLETA